MSSLAGWQRLAQPRRTHSRSVCRGGVVHAWDFNFLPRTMISWNNFQKCQLLDNYAKRGICEPWSWENCGIYFFKVSSPALYLFVCPLSCCSELRGGNNVASKQMHFPSVSFGQQSRSHYESNNSEAKMKIFCSELIRQGTVCIKQPAPRKGGVGEHGGITSSHLLTPSEGCIWWPCALFMII